MMAGVLFALAAGLMWGLIFVGPLIVPEYPAMLQSAGRYVAFGLIALPLAWADRRRVRQLTRGDWKEAFKLSAVGNLLYYVCLAGAIQRTGAPISTMIIGTLPVVIAVSANLLYGRHEGRLAWHQLLPSLLLIGAGLCLVNIAELRGDGGPQNIGRYLSGIGLALVALVCWTWYPLRNARWMRSHPQHRAGTWATAQGIAVLPMALVAYALACGQMTLANDPFPLPFGPRPGLFIALMAAIGLFCSWLGTLCWSEASQRLPTVLVGPLIVFEILAGLAYTFLLRQSWPPLLTLCGIACLMIGVVSAMRIKPEPLPA